MKEMRKKRVAKLLCLFLLLGQGWVARGQDLSGLSICIDPGHGPGNANQGPTGLKEHVINMKVARFVERYLKSANVDTVILTRTENDPDISLSQREAIANGNGVDWFHSIHHNAFNGTARYTMVLYQEVIGENRPRWPEAYDMCMVMAPEIYRGLRTSAWYVRSDYDVRGFNFGVLNDLTMPGELSEGTFHDHPVEEAKLKNRDFLRFEGLAIFRSFLQYFDGGPLPYGALGGIVYDHDTGKPINGATVRLFPIDSMYVTDQNNNGFYAFPQLAPGKYILEVSAENYFSARDSIQVAADKFNFLDFRLVSTIPPVVTQSFPADGEENVSPYGFIGLIFNRPMNPDSVEKALHINPDFPYITTWLDGNRRLKIDPLTILEFDREYTVTIDSTAQDIYGRFLDGDGDGTPGDPFVLRFRTKPLDPQRPYVLETHPIDYQKGFFPADVMYARISKPFDLATVTKDHLILRGGSRLPLEILVHQSITPSGQAVLSILPQQFFRFGLSYVLNFTTFLKDSSGNPLGESYLFRFTTAYDPLNLYLLPLFRDTTGVWEEPAKSPRSAGIVAGETYLAHCDSLHLRMDPPVLQLHYRFLEDGMADLPLVQSPDTLQHLQDGEVIGCYVLSDRADVQVRFYFLDQSDGYEAGPWLPLRPFSWTFVSFRVGRDSVTAYEGGNGTLDGEIHFAGLQIRGHGGQQGSLFFADFIYGTQPGLEVEENDSDRLPEVHVLIQSYPNPYSHRAHGSGVVISFSIPDQLGENPVDLEIYNMLGQKVKHLVKDTRRPGFYQVFWDVRDDLGRPLPAGVYFYRLQVGPDVQTHRLVILN